LPAPTLRTQKSQCGIGPVYGRIEKVSQEYFLLGGVEGKDHPKWTGVGKILESLNQERALEDLVDQGTSRAVARGNEFHPLVHARRP
jgi:hypothetical protein